MSGLLRQRVNAAFFVLAQRLAPKRNGARAGSGQRPGLVEDNRVHPRQGFDDGRVFEENFPPRQDALRRAKSERRGQGQRAGQATINTETNEARARLESRHDQKRPRPPPRPEQFS